jgi:GxxExxY protein
MTLAEMIELEEINKLTQEIIDTAIEVHRALGPGKDESANQVQLNSELTEKGLMVEVRKPLAVEDEHNPLEAGDRAVLLIEDQVIIEVITADQLTQNHHDQLHSYLKLSGYKVGLLVNFNVQKIEDGIKRLINY